MQNKPKHKKINLEFVGEDFSIDKEHGKIKCILTYKTHFKDFAELYGRPSDTILSEGKKTYAVLMDVFKKDTFKTSAVSLCGKNDVFDLDLGLEIARQRARARAERKYNYWLRLYISLMKSTQRRLLKALSQSCVAMDVNNYFEKLYTNAI